MAFRMQAQRGTMMRSTARYAVLILVAAVSACASTTLDYSWKDPKYTGGPVRKVLVAGISNQASVRRVFEDTFAQALMEAGAQAVPSYTLIPEDGKLPEGSLRKAVEQAGADGVLITRMTARETEVSVTPSPRPPPAYGMQRHYYGGYSGAWMGYYEPDTVQQFNYAVTETTLYRTDAPEPVWAGTARTQDPRDVRGATADFSKVVIAALKKAGLI
jgi:hypothetical protein